LVLFAGFPPIAHSQDLTPRAYLITPTGSHAIILSSSFSSGAVVLDPTAPVEDAHGRIQVATLGYCESFDLLGRSATVTAVLPYARANFQGTLDSTVYEAYRSGLGDARVRLAVNLSGGPAMNTSEYLKWQEKRLLGASLTVIIPNGQYDSARGVNIGANRWGFKPEIGFTRRWGRLVLDAYGGVWFFTGNDSYFPGERLRTQSPVGAIEGHLAYYLKRRLWASADINFWDGGRSSVNGIAKQDRQRDSRMGGTMAVPINNRQSLKFSYSQGAYVTIGGAYRTYSAGWQYSWISQPR
jgi:Putative MetA-pathway of phenol degradation